ncbi:hypothetical protein M569_02158, partial [Genlisea aurea]
PSLIMAIQWLTLVAAIWLQAINGTNSNFPAYSSELKRLLSISQLQLNNLASASDAGKLLGWISGLAASYFPLWLVLLIGALLSVVGYGVQFLFLTNRIPNLSYWQIFLLTVLAGNSICWINTVCYIIAIRNFPLDRQIAVGLSTSYVGLTAKIYTDVVDVTTSFSFGNNRARSFIFLNAVVPLLLCIVVAPLARGVDAGKSKRLTRGFFLMFVVTISNGVFAVVTSFGSLNKYVIIAGVTAFLLLPLIVPVTETVIERVKGKCLIRVHDADVKCQFTEIHRNLESGGEITKGSDFRVTEEGVVQEIGAAAMVATVEFWLYYLVYLLGATLGLVFLNNLGQIAESRGCSNTSSLVCLSSAFGFFGRLSPSLFDYFLPSKKMVTRSGAMGMMMLPLCGAFFLLVDSEDTYLYVSASVIGACTGAITSISVSATTELFGAKNFGVNHNILVSNIPVGSFLFGDLAALVYGRYGRNTGNCLGEMCYRNTFIAWGCLCVLGTCLAFVLHVRTRRL